MAQEHGFSRQRWDALELVLQKGIFAGFGAGTAMGLFAMLTSATYAGRGLFTPAYHVAFTIDPNTLLQSLQKAEEGDRFFFSQQSFIFGVAGHVMVGALLGALFAVLAMRLHLRERRALVGGLIYGLTVMVIMSTLVLPVVARMSGAGQPISQMGGDIGWPTWVVLHAIFGSALGLWIYVRPQDVEG
jgi:uncharacterized membrane protein YagU involved in acid resistance